MGDKLDLILDDIMAMTGDDVRERQKAILQTHIDSVVNDYHDSINIIIKVMDYASDSEQMNINRHVWVVDALRNMLDGIPVVEPPRLSETP